MSIGKIYDSQDFGAALDAAQHNCACCAGCGCKDINCPSQKALMSVAENRFELNDYERKKYFEQIGG